MMTWCQTRKRDPNVDICSDVIGFLHSYSLEWWEVGWSVMLSDIVVDVYGRDAYEQRWKKSIDYSIRFTDKLFQYLSDGLLFELWMFSRLRVDLEVGTVFKSQYNLQQRFYQPKFSLVKFHKWVGNEGVFRECEISITIKAWCWNPFCFILYSSFLW